MKTFLLIFLLFLSILTAQPQRGERISVAQQLFQSETIIIPKSTNNFNLYYTYKIPYNRLVFERDNGNYSAGLRVLVEIEDQQSNLIDRDIKDTELIVNNFEATNERGFFLQDYLKFELTGDKYFVKTTITDLNSQNELKLEPAKIELTKIPDEKILHPLVIETKDTECEIENAFKLANFGGNVPFSPNAYNLIIPLIDTSVQTINVSIINNEDTLLSSTITELYEFPIGISKCNSNLVVQQDDESIETINFVVRNVNEKLREGRVKLTVIHGEEIIKEFNSEVIWIDKPFSLRDPAMAIELLKYITADSVISRLLSVDELDYPRVLHEYWNGFDPTPETSYNQLMTEYYRRIDYAAKEFRGLGKENGVKTDRGMIYIRFGKPEDVERSSNNQGQVVETWTYKNPERKFVFVDKRGIGNFTLIDN
ncbi:MAG: GWxTD domain-containing protein [Ignavibacteria bacterium]|nr:GWxTD domain-containing protein [Ignavibacteria bacterium]NNL21257.1 GWxTD domain-containing protein [Ignavibacteriaceae bacterium]